MRAEGTNAPVGIFPEAFALRPGERDLSVCWMEYFKGDKYEQLKQVAEHAELKLNPRHGYGTIGVGTLMQACENHGAKVRIIHEPTDGNPCHSSVHRYPRDNDELKALLANIAGDNLTLVGDLS